MYVAQSRNPKLSLKGAVRTLRGIWRRGTYTEFDALLSRIAQVDLETAQKIRETWESLDLLAYDSEGFLVWYHRGF
jgi:hypothetical protein